jgi:curved DNA-binding protein CbpA
VDLVRACAVLEVTPSATQREVKRAYKKLVRRWHPDRFANDPRGQAEATARLQMITEAYSVVVHALDARVYGAQQYPAGERPHDPGGRLPREEVERLVRAMNRDSPLQAFLNQPMWWWPLPIGLALLLPSAPPASPWQTTSGLILIVSAPILWWFDRRSRRG